MLIAFSDNKALKCMCLEYFAFGYKFDAWYSTILERKEYIRMVPTYPDGV